MKQTIFMKFASQIFQCRSVSPYVSTMVQTIVAKSFRVNPIFYSGYFWADSDVQYFWFRYVHSFVCTSVSNDFLFITIFSERWGLVTWNVVYRWPLYWNAQTKSLMGISASVRLRTTFGANGFVYPTDSKKFHFIPSSVCSRILTQRK